MDFLRARVLLATTAACLVGSLGACTTLPHYEKPSAPVPATFSSDPNWRVARPADLSQRGAWWEVFADPTLNDLESRLALSNQTVQQAVAQLQQARAQLAYQHAGLFPTLSANASSVPYHTSRNLVGKSLAGKTIPDHVVGVTASWEPDLFGRIEDATVNARANAEASEADLAAVKLSASSDLAIDYLNYRSLEEQGRLLERAVTAYTAAYNILTQQLQHGAIDASAVAQAQTQLESTKTQATDIQAQTQVLQHAIATLIGVPASGFQIPVAQTSPQLPDIPVALPSQLLERRPDIAAAERRVAAANAQIGLARAAYYPSLQLSGSAGLQSTFLSPWLTAPSLFWSIGPQLVGTLFDGGQRKAQLEDAKGQYGAAVANYRQTVLVSFQEVEDDLSNLVAVASEEQSQDRATTAAKLALKLTSNRFQAGAVSYLDVVTAQTIALQNERLNEQLAARRLTSSVALIKALGGNWQKNHGD